MGDVCTLKSPCYDKITILLFSAGDVLMALGFSHETILSNIEYFEALPCNMYMKFLKTKSFYKLRTGI